MLKHRIALFTILFLCCSIYCTSLNPNLRNLQDEEISISFDQEKYNINEKAIVTFTKGDDSYHGNVYYKEGESTEFIKLPLIDGKGELIIKDSKYTFYYSDRCGSPTESWKEIVHDIQQNIVDIDSYDSLFNNLKNPTKNLIIRLSQSFTIPNANNTMEDRLNVNGQVVLDLNGQTISFESELEGNDDKNYMVLYVYGNLTIIDSSSGKNGMIDGSKKNYAISVYDGGNLTILEGNFKGSTTAIQVVSGNTYLKGGNYEAIPWDDGNGGDQYRFTINCIDKNYQTGKAKHFITGGKYYKYNPSLNLGENPSFSLVPGGWRVKEDGEYFVVEPEIEISSSYQENVITIKCIIISEQNPCNGNLFIKAPNSDTFEKLIINSDVPTYSYPYEQYGNYEVYYTKSSTCEIPTDENKPHDAIYPVHIVEISDPYLFVTNECELNNELSKTTKTFIKLGNDIELTDSTTKEIKTTVYLDLNGKTLNIKQNIEEEVDMSNEENDVIFTIEGDLTVVDNKDGGMIDSSNKKYPFLVTNGHSLTILSGKYIAKSTIIQIKGGNVYIRGGTFQVSENNDFSHTLNFVEDSYKTGAANVIITGGKFYKYEPKITVEETSYSFVPEGWTVTHNTEEGSGDKDYYIVEKTISITYDKNNKIIQCSNSDSTCLDYFYVKQPDNTINKLNIENGIIPFSYESYGIYEIYYSKNENDLKESNIPHNAIYPIEIVEIKDPYSYVLNECELKEALLKEGEIFIKLKNDVTFTEIMERTVKTTVNLNLNEKKITINYDSLEEGVDESKLSVFYVSIGGHLIINGEGEINGRNTKNNNGIAIIVDNNGQLTIENGKFIGDTVAIYSKNSQQIEIKGGYYEVQSDNYENTIKCESEQCNIRISGGKFYSFNPSKEGLNFIDKDNYDVSGSDKNAAEETGKTEYKYYSVIPKKLVTFTTTKYFKGDKVIVECKWKDNSYCNGKFCYYKTEGDSFTPLQDEDIAQGTYSFTSESLGDYHLFYVDGEEADCSKIVSPIYDLTIHGQEQSFKYIQYNNADNNLEIDIISTTSDFAYSNVEQIFLTKFEGGASSDEQISKCQNGNVQQCFSCQEDLSKITLYLTISDEEYYKINYLKVKQGEEEERYFENKSPTLGKKEVNYKLKYDLSIYHDQTMILYFDESSFVECKEISCNYYLGDIQFTECTKSEEETKLTCKINIDTLIEPSPKDMIFSLKETEYNYYYNAQMIHLVTYTVPDKNCQVISFNENNQSTTTFVVKSSTDKISVDDGTSSGDEIQITIEEGSLQKTFSISYQDSEFLEKIPSTPINYIDNTVEGIITLNQNKNKIVIPFKTINANSYIKAIKVTVKGDNGNEETVQSTTSVLHDKYVIYSFEKTFDSGTNVIIEYLNNQCDESNNDYSLLKETTLELKSISAISSHILNKEEFTKTFTVTFAIDILETPTLSLENINESISLPCILSKTDNPKEISFTLQNENDFLKIGIYQIKILFYEDEDTNDLTFNNYIYIYTDDLLKPLTPTSTAISSLNEAFSSVSINIEQDISELLFFYELYYVQDSSTEEVINVSFESVKNKLTINSDKTFNEFGVYEFKLKNKIIQQLNKEELDDSNKKDETSLSFNVEVHPNLEFNRYNYIISTHNNVKLTITIESQEEFNLITNICVENDCGTNNCDKSTTSLTFDCTFTIPNDKKEISFTYNSNLIIPQKVAIHQNINELFDIKLSNTCLYYKEYEVSVELSLKDDSQLFDIPNKYDINLVGGDKKPFTYKDGKYTLSSSSEELTPGEYKLEFIENKDKEFPLDSETIKVTMTDLIPLNNEYFINNSEYISILFKDVTCAPSSITLDDDITVDCNDKQMNSEKQISCSIILTDNNSYGEKKLKINKVDTEYSINLMKPIDKCTPIITTNDILYGQNNDIKIEIPDFNLDYVSAAIVKREDHLGNKKYIPYFKKENGDIEGFTIEKKDENSEERIMTINLFTTYDETISVAQICQKDYNNNPIEVSNEDELSNSISNASNGDIIKLKEDIVITQNNIEEINIISSIITLDLNGHKISINEKKNDNSYGFVVDGGELTITGNGIIDFTLDNEENTGSPIKVKNGKVIIKNGTFKGYGTIIDIVNGSALIQGGYYEVKPYTTVEDNNMNYEDTIKCSSNVEPSCNIYIQGGSFYQYNPSLILDETYYQIKSISVSDDISKNEVTNIFGLDREYLQGDLVTFVKPEGITETFCYKKPSSTECTNIDRDSLILNEIGEYDIYLSSNQKKILYSIESKLKVVYAVDLYDLNFKLTRSLKGQIIKLMNDITIEDYSTESIKEINQDITLDLNGKTISINKGTDDVTTDVVAIKINGGNVIIKGNGIIDTSNIGTPIQVNEGTLTIENGTFRGKDNVLDIKEKAFVYIKGGNYNMLPPQHCIINGGTFDFENVESLTSMIAGGFSFDTSKKEIEQDVQIDYQNGKCKQNTDISFITTKEGNFYYKIKGKDENLQPIDSHKFTALVNGEYEIYYFTENQDDLTIKNILPISSILCSDGTEMKYEGLYQEEDTFICYNTKDIHIPSSSFSFGESDNIIFIKSKDEPQEISFKLNFVNESSYDIFKDRIILKNKDDTYSSISCEKDKSEPKIANCKVDVSQPVILEISLKDSLTPKKKIEVLDYSFNNSDESLCQTKFNKDDELNKNKEVELTITLPESTSITLQSGKIGTQIVQFSENKFVFDISSVNEGEQDDNNEIAITINYSIKDIDGDKEITLPEKIRLNPKYEMIFDEEKLKFPAQNNQELIIKFNGEVKKEDISSIGLIFQEEDSCQTSLRLKELDININDEQNKCEITTSTLEGETIISETILTCSEIDFSNLMEGFYSIYYTDSCSQHNKILSKYKIYITIFDVPRNIYVLNNGLSEPQSITITSNADSNINLCVSKNEEDECQLLGTGKEQNSWTYSFTDQDKTTYQFYYKLDECKYQINNGEVKVFKDITEIIDINTNLCFYYKNSISFNINTEVIKDYLNIHAYLKDNERKNLIQWNPNEEGNLVTDNYEERVREGTFYIVENKDENTPLYKSSMSLIDLTLETKYLFNKDTILTFSASCSPSSLTLTIDEEKNILCTQQQKRQDTDPDNKFICSFSKTKDFENYGKGKEIFINNNKIGSIFISKLLTEATINYLFVEEGKEDLVITENDSVYGEKRIKVSSNNYYIPNINQLILQFDGEDKQRKLICEDNDDNYCISLEAERNDNVEDSVDKTIIFTLKIGYNDIVTIKDIQGIENELIQPQLKINGPSFIIDNPYLFFIKQDDTVQNDITFDFNIIFKDIIPSQDTYTIHYINDDNSISLSHCTLNKDTESSYKCQITKTESIPNEISIYINDSVNKNKIKLYFITYSITNKCQTIHIDKNDNKPIVITLEHSSTLLSTNFDATLTGVGKPTITTNDNGNTVFTFSNTELSEPSNTLTIKYSESTETIKDIFTISDLITLYSLFSIKEVKTSIKIIPTDKETEKNKKEITFDIQFNKEIYYNNNILTLYNKDIEDETYNLICSNEIGKIETLTCSITTDSDKEGTFGIKYKDECGKENIDTNANIKLTNSNNEPSFIFNNNIYFINNNEESKEIEIKLKILPSFKDITKRIFSFENGYKIDCSGEGNDECTFNTEDQTATFKYSISKDIKKLLIYYNDNILQNNTLYLGRYSFNNQQCNTIGYTIDDIILTIDYSFDYDSSFNVYLFNENNNIQGTSELKTILGDKQIIYTFKQSLFTQEGDYKIGILINEDEDNKISLDETIKFINTNTIISADNHLIYDEDNKIVLNIKFENELKGNENIILTNNDNIIDSWKCIRNEEIKNILSCEYTTENENKPEGEYLLSVIDSCGINIPSNISITIASKLVITLEDINPQIIIQGNNDLITLKYSNVIQDKISLIKLIGQNTKKEIELKDYQQDQLNNQIITFNPSSLVEDQYIIETSFKDIDTDISSKTLNVTKQIKIEAVYIDNNKQNNTEEITIYKGSTINYIKVYFDLEIYQERIESVKYGDNDLQYLINTDENNLYKVLLIQTSEIKFINEENTITIKDKAHPSTSFTIIIKTDSSVTINIPQYVYLYKDEKPEIKITANGIDSLYYIKDNKYIEITNKTANNIYNYSPNSRNEEVYFAFKINNERKDYNTPIYIIDDIHTILDLNIDECIPLFNDELSIDYNLNENVKLNNGLFNIDYLPKADGKYTIKIYYDNILLHEQDVTVTTVSFNTNEYISSSQSQIELFTSHCIPQSKYFKINNNIPIISCGEIVNNKVKCNFDGNLIKEYGTNTITYNNKEIGTINIYRTLSESVKLIKPIYPIVGKNLISISTNMYNLTTIIFEGINDSDYIERKTNSLSFYVTINEGENKKDIIYSSTENGKEIKLKDILYVTAPKFEVNQNVIFMREGKEDIEFEVIFEKENDLQLFKSEIYFNNILSTCEEKTTTTLSCKVKRDEYEGTISIKKIWNSEPVNIVKYNKDDDECSSIIQFTSKMKLEGYSFSVDNIQLSEDETHDNSFVYNADFSGKRINKGELTIKKDNKEVYTFNDIEIISFTDKEIGEGSTSKIYKNMEEQYITLVFNQELEDNEIEKVQLTSDNNKNIIDIKNCNLGSNLTELLCKLEEIPSSSTSPMIYTVEYTKKCSNENTKTSYHINLVNSSKLLSFKENLINSQNLTINLVYKGDFTKVTIEKLTFTDISNRKNKFELKPIIDDNPEITLTIPNNTYGIYYCEAITSNNEVIPVEGSITIYDKPLSYQGKDIYLFNNELLDAELIFENILFKGRIISILLEPNSINWSLKEKSIIVSSDNLITSDTKIIVTDISKSTIEITIKVIQSQLFTIEQEFYIHQQSSLDLKYFPSDIENPIIKSENGITFKLEKEKKQLIYSSLTSSPMKEGLFSIKFYYNANTKYLSSEKIYFVNSNSIPSKVTTDLVLITEGESSFNIKFDKPIKQEYLQYIKSNTISQFTYIDKYTIKVQTYSITSDTTFAFTIFETKLQFKVQILKCNRPELEYKINDVLQCVTCKDIDSNKPYYYASTESCLSSCPTGTFYNELECVDECPIYNEKDKCVSECSEDYGRKSTTLKECIKCSDLSADNIAIDGICESDCIDGALVNVNGTCLLPEKIHETFKEEDKCKGYCKNGNCTLKNNVPICTCPEGYYGPACEMEDSKAEEYLKDVEDKLFPIYDKQGKENKVVEVRLTSVKVAVEIKQMISYAKKTDYIEKMEPKKQDLIVKSTHKSLTDMIKKETKPKENVFHLVSLSLMIYIKKINGKRLRRLDETEEINGVKDLMNNAHLALERLAIEDSNLNDTNSVILADATEDIFYQYSRTTSASLKERENKSNNNSLTVVDFGNCFKQNDQLNDYYVVTTDITENFKQQIGSAAPNTKLTVVNKNNLESNSIPQCDVTCKIGLLNDLNPELYNYYISNGINIYNPNDPAFKNKCYYNKDLSYDTTPSYRRKYIYQGKSLAMNTNCSLVDDASGLNYLLVQCPLGESLDYNIQDEELKNLNEKTSNVPISCPEDIDNISTNIGFWIYLVIFVFIITFSIIYFSLIKKGNEIVSHMLKNDNLIKDDVKFTKVATTENVQTKPNNERQESEVKVEDIKISVNKKEDKPSFGKVLINNLKEIHPLISLSRVSIISPILYNSWIFVFNILCLFGFNALYLTNGKIEQRIYDNDRDNFGYPVKSEFEKIMSAIVSTIVLTVIVKAISLVTYSQKKDLEIKIDNGKDITNTENAINEFTKSMLPRRIISWVFMLLVSVFFFYYSIVFCGIYIHTQYGWFYSCLWSLFFNWVLFANVFIFILSVVEFSCGNESAVYYMKRLFIF